MGWTDLWDFGQDVYKGIKLTRQLFGDSKSSRDIDPQQHQSSRPYASLRATRKLFRSDAPRDAYLDTEGDEGERDVPVDGKTAYSQAFRSTFAKLKGFTEKL